MDTISLQSAVLDITPMPDQARKMQIKFDGEAWRLRFYDANGRKIAVASYFINGKVDTKAENGCTWSHMDKMPSELPTFDRLAGQHLLNTPAADMGEYDHNMEVLPERITHPDLSGVDVDVLLREFKKRLAKGHIKSI